MSYIKMFKTQRPYGLKSAQIFHDFFSNPQSRSDLNTIENQTKHRNRIRKPRSIKVRILHNGTIKFGVNFHNDYYISSTEVVFCEVILTRLSFPKELLLAIKYATCLESLLSLLSLYLSSAILLLTCEIWNLVIHRKASRDWFLWTNGNTQRQKPILRFFWAQVDFWSSVSVYGFNGIGRLWILRFISYVWKGLSHW